MLKLRRPGTLMLFSVCISIAMGCSASIKRSGYVAPAVLSASDCVVAIKYQYPRTSDEVVLGRVEVLDSGFSVECDAEYVLHRLQEDACALGADVVNITEERGPDSASNCYRAEAEFLRLTDRRAASALASDARYVGDALRQRSAESAHGMNDAVIAGMVGGMIGAAIAP